MVRSIFQDEPSPVWSNLDRLEKRIDALEKRINELLEEVKKQ